MTKPHISWQDSIWFFDVDDTLINTSEISDEATVGIEKVFTEEFDAETGKKVRQEVNRLYNLLLNGYRVTNNDWSNVEGGKEAFDKTLKEVFSYQNRVIETYGEPKKWSREIFIAIASSILQVDITPDLVTKAADAYWGTLTKIVQPYQDALRLFEAIKKHNRPIFLITSSDARLQMADDNQFDYDPAFSERKKRERLAILKEKEFDFDALSIGDPEDKPHQDFFEKGIATAEKSIGQKIDTNNAVMVGDSFTGDLKTPKEKMGFGLVSLYDRNLKEITVVDENQVNTGNLVDLEQFFH